VFALNFETKRYRDRRPNGKKKIIRDLLQELGSKSGARYLKRFLADLLRCFIFGESAGRRFDFDS
jgi:hypothetical protein